MVHYRLAEQGPFRLSQPVLRLNSTEKVLPKGRAGEVRSAEEESGRHLPCAQRGGREQSKPGRTMRSAPRPADPGAAGLGPPDDRRRAARGR
jgi:hypothetical protein